MFKTLPIGIVGNIEELKQEFTQHFNSPSQRIHAKNLIGKRSQKPNETLAEYYEAICTLVQRAWGTKSIEFQKENPLELFIKGLKPTIKKIFWGEKPENLDNAYQKARTRELYLISQKGKCEVRSVNSEKPLEAQDKGSTAHGENSDIVGFPSRAVRAAS